MKRRRWNAKDWRRIGEACREYAATLADRNERAESEALIDLAREAESEMVRVSAPTPVYVLSYNQPTCDEHGRVIPGTTWYAAKRPGDGGSDWAYTKEVSEAGAFSEYWRRRWFKRHSRASATQVEPAP